MSDRIPETKFSFITSKLLNKKKNIYDKIIYDFTFLEEIDEDSKISIFCQTIIGYEIRLVVKKRLSYNDDFILILSYFFKSLTNIISFGDPENFIDPVKIDSANNFTSLYNINLVCIELNENILRSIISSSTSSRSSSSITNNNLHSFAGGGGGTQSKKSSSHRSPLGVHEAKDVKDYISIKVGCPYFGIFPDSSDAQLLIPKGSTLAEIESIFKSIIPESVRYDYEIYFKINSTHNLIQLIINSDYYRFMKEKSNHEESKNGKKVFDFFRNNPNKDNRQDISDLFMTIHQIRSGMEFSLRRSSLAMVEPRQSMSATALKDRQNDYFYGVLQKLITEKKVISFRKVRGDGNCYYRSIIFGLLEDIITDRSPERLTVLREILANAKNVKDLEELLTYKESYNIDPAQNIVQPNFYRTFERDLNWLLQKIDATIANFNGNNFGNDEIKPWATKEVLEYDIIRSARLDQILVLTSKILEANWLIINQDKDVDDGLTLKIACMTEDMIDYCREQTMRNEKSAEGTAIEKGALSYVFHCDLEITVRSRNPKINISNIYNRYFGKNKIGSITCFLNPGHYDLLYISKEHNQDVYGGGSKSISAPKVHPNSCNKIGGGGGPNTTWTCTFCSAKNSNEDNECYMCTTTKDGTFNPNQVNALLK